MMLVASIGSSDQADERVLQLTPGVVELEQIERSSGEDVGAKAINNELGQEFVQALAGLTDDIDGDLRAHLALAWIVGIDLVRAVGGSEPLASATTEQVVRNVLPAVRTLLAALPDLPLMPTGGIGRDDAWEWIRAGAVAVGMGSALQGVTPEQLRYMLATF